VRDQIVRNVTLQPLQLHRKIGLRIQGHRRSGLKNLRCRQSPVRKVALVDRHPDRRQPAAEIAAVPEMFSQGQRFPEQPGHRRATIAYRHPGGTGTLSIGDQAVHRGRMTAGKGIESLLQPGAGKQGQAGEVIPVQLPRIDVAQRAGVIGHGVARVAQHEAQLMYLQFTQARR